MKNDIRHKIKLIRIEIKKSFTQIKNIIKPSQISGNNKYLSLTPIPNADDDHAYSDMLKFALAKKDINNIAVTGPYGSGKSSVLLTFQTQNPNWKYLNISLATFKDHLNTEGNDKEIEIETIEKSILQQLFYYVDQKTLPRSRLKRIVTIQTRELLANTLFIFLWAFLTLFLFFPENIFFDKFSILANSDQLAQTTFSLLFLLYCIVGLFTGIKYIEKIKELKLKFQDTEITLNNNEIESILNKHLDEILYFFERTDFDVIVIEDLDRFENSEIFIRLRELNTLINNSKQVNRHIVFLYAIRDNMFKDKDRSKFFDFIIPIIPIINPTNAYDLIRKNYINEENDSQLHKEIEDVFLHQISLFFDDMRLVTNIFNEFKLYVNKLQNPNLNKNKLLALIIYKNHYPSEFANLHSNKGEIYEIFKIKKKNIVERKLVIINQEISNLENKIQVSELEKMQNITEIRKLYIYEILSRMPIVKNFNRSGYNIQYSQISYLIKLKTESLDLDYQNLTSDENFEIIKNSKKLEWVLEIQTNDQYMRSEIENIKDTKFTFQTIEKMVHSTLSYQERVARIKNNEAKNREKALEQKQNLLNKKDNLKLNTLKELLSKDISEEFFNSENHPPLLQFLIREGYIDEHYPDYISFFIDSVININERDYAQCVINHINSDFDITLTNVKKILEKYLTPRQFSHTSILNFSLVDFILDNHDKFNDHYNNLFKLLSNQDERSIQFIFEYIDRGENSSLFINKIVKSWQNFFEHIHMSMIDEKIESYLLLILKNIEKENIPLLNKDDILKNYLSSKSNFIEYIKHTYSTEQEILKFLQLVKPIFEYLDCKNKDDVSIFNEICRNEYFKFNEKMILQIICINNEDKKYDEIQKTFRSKPYETLQYFAPDYLISQVDQSIDHFFEEVYIPSSENLNESSNYFLKLINNQDLDNSHKKWLIEKNDIQIDLISSIHDSQFWKPILANNKVKPSWDSLIAYYQDIKNTLDNVIINYINTNNTFLKEQKLLNTESKKNIPDLTDEFEIELLSSDSFSDIAYEAIIAVRMFNYDSLYISNLSKSKISLLIHKKVLSLTSENVENLRKKSTDFIIDLIVMNLTDECIELKDELILEQKEYELLLSSSNLTIKQKLIIIKKLDIDFYNNSSIKLTINDIYIKSSQSLPTEYIDSFFKTNHSDERKIDILIYEMKNLVPKQISEFLMMLNSPYNLISLPGNHTLDYTYSNENLINALKSCSYIYNVRIHTKKLLGTKTKITFTTKP